jgi:protein-disulfide isomerase
VLPAVIDRYVRASRLKLELNVLSFVGDDSVRAGQMAGAAAEQGKLWDFADAFYARQGQETPAT